MQAVQEVVADLDLADYVAGGVVEGWFGEVFLQDWRFYFYDHLLCVVQRDHWELAAVPCEDDLIVSCEVDVLDEATAFKLVFKVKVVQFQLLLV